jgi:hypothetical protein
MRLMLRENMIPLSEEVALQMLELLGAHKADIDEFWPILEHGQSALFLGRENPTIFRHLLKKGASVNKQAGDLSTIGKGIETTANALGLSNAMPAALSGIAEYLRRFVPKFYIELPTGECLGKHVVLHLAAYYGETANVRLLLNNHFADVDPKTAAPEEYTPLYLAASQGHLDVVQALVEAGADVDARCKGCERPNEVAKKYASREQLDGVRRDEYTKVINYLEGVMRELAWIKRANIRNMPSIAIPRTISFEPQAELHPQVDVVEEDQVIAPEEQRQIEAVATGIGAIHQNSPACHIL